jgi:TatD family hydrolase
MEPLFDSHAHLSFPGFDDDRAAVIERARDAGVLGIIDIGSGDGTESFARAVTLARDHDGIWATAGLHPHDARLGSSEVLDDLARAAIGRDVVAVGETGLDYHYDNSPREDQRRMFRAQVRLARSVDKPVIVHTREADEDTLSILRDEGIGEAGGVVHCFSGGPELARSLLGLGLHVSFSGIVTFSGAIEVRDAARVVPDDRLLIETDSPYLAPPPHRGRRNEPAFVADVARTVAEIRGVTVDDVARITSLNTRRLFRLPVAAAAPIVYAIRDQLYVNVTNACTLSCVFCPKRRDWTVKGHVLRHTVEPSDDDVVAAIAVHGGNPFLEKGFPPGPPSRKTTENLSSNVVVDADVVVDGVAQKHSTTSATTTTSTFTAGLFESGAQQGAEKNLSKSFEEGARGRDLHATPEKSLLRERFSETFREVVFCGLGEPTTRLDLVVRMAGELRAAGIRTRLDTDGLACLREGRDVTADIARVFDAVSVSLNAADAETYQRLCPSPYGASAWHAVVGFLRAAVAAIPDVTATVVAYPGLDVEAARRLAEGIGARFRARPYNIVG